MGGSISSSDQGLDLREGILALHEVQVGCLSPYNPYDDDGVQFELDAHLYRTGYVCDGTDDPARRRIHTWTS